jgi:hypothetical protein
MEYEGGAEKEREEPIDRAPSTQQHIQHEGDQSDVEEEGREKEQVVTDVCFEENTPVPSDTEGPNATQPTKRKRPKNLRLDRRGSPPRERSRSRVRSVLLKI